MSGLVHPAQHVRNATQNSLVLEDEVLPGTENADQPTEEMSEPESYRKSPNRALRQVIHFAGVRRFGEAQDSLPRVQRRIKVGLAGFSVRFPIARAHWDSSDGYR